MRGLIIAGFALLLAGSIACVSAVDDPAPRPAPARIDKIECWNVPLRGAVYSGYYGEGVAADLDAARGYNISFMRLFFPGIQAAPESAIDMPGAMSNEDAADWDSAYFESPRFTEGLDTLDATIALAAQRGMKLVLSPGPVPGSHGKGPVRWRLFRRDRWHWAFAEFWKRLAARYRDNPAIVGYLLLNEPGFEVTSDITGDDRDALRAYYRSVRGTPADLNLLYRRTVAAIREVDPHTPIIVQPGLWGRPHALEFLDPIDDDRVLYCVHWYGPWLFTTWRMNRGRWTYPGLAPSNFAGDADHPGDLMAWDIGTLRRRMADPIKTWQASHNIPSNRIYVGEFGVDRRVPGADAWLGDMLTIIEENGWHWTYYMFREREWSAMDHELGPDDQGPRTADTATMRVIREALRR